MSAVSGASGRHSFDPIPVSMQPVPSLDPTPRPRASPLELPREPVEPIDDPERDAIERITAEQRRILSLLW